MRNRFAIFTTSAVRFLGSEDATFRNNFLRTIEKLQKEKFEEPPGAL
jgi:hypothetical protein